MCVGVALHDAGTRDVWVWLCMMQVHVICVWVWLCIMQVHVMWVWLCIMQVHVMCVVVALHDAGTRDMCRCGFA